MNTTTTVTPTPLTVLPSILIQHGISTDDANSIASIICTQYTSHEQLLTLTDEQIFRSDMQGKLKGKMTITVTFEAIQTYIKTYSSMTSTSLAKKSWAIPFQHTSQPGEIFESGTKDFINAIDFSIDGSLMFIACDDHRVGVFSFPSMERLKWCVGHENQVYCIAVSKRGDYVASAGFNGHTIVWQACEPFDMVQLLPNRGTENYMVNCV
jgi:WD40 repeat protein